MSPAHCSADIALVPLSVSRSMKTSRLRSWKVFHPASASAASRSARVVRRMCSTALILYGSAHEWRRTGADSVM